jgi:hypothetical protein
MRFSRRSSNHQARLAMAIGFAAGLGLLYWRRRRARAEARAIEDRAPVTQATVPVNPADAPMGTPGRNEEQRLDEALQETFPTSDPVSIRIE